MMLKDKKVIPQKRGINRRKDILLKSRYGIRLNIEGGVELDNDMRRLMDEGLVHIKRYRMGSWGGVAKVSRLILTDLGRAKLVEMGFDPDENQYKESDKPKFIAHEDVITEDVRRVVMEDGRKYVHLVRPAKGSDKIYDGDVPVKYITYGWNKGDIVYHFLDEIPSIRQSNPLIPAGFLRETGRGLVLSHTHILQAVGDPKESYYPMTTEPITWFELKKTLTMMCDNVRFIYRREHSPSGLAPTLYILCNSETDFITAKMVFGEGVRFTGYN